MSCSEEPVEVIIPLVKTITSLSFRNLSLTVGGKGDRKELLKNISGTFRSGRLTAVIGPSGSGKSSLLRALSGFKTRVVKGRILINNEVVDRPKYRQIVAYTTQDVPLLQELTVQETLHFAADLRLPTSVTRIHKTKIVNDIVALLRLEKCAHSRAAVLSEGEKRRLAIGLELVSNPKIMFFDEPTSGLDMESSYRVVSCMKDLVKQGRCVVCVIHQPSSELLELFDDIYVIANGRCMYQGSLDDMIPTLAEAGFVCPQYYNRADFAMKIATSADTESDKISQLMEHTESLTNGQINGFHNEQQHLDNGKLLEEGRGSSPQYPISQFQQLLILTRRTALRSLRNLTLTRVRILGHILFGLLLGAVFYDVGDNGAKVLSNISVLLLILMFIVFSNSMPIVLTFPLEIAVFAREHKRNCYSAAAYLFSKLVADFPLMLSGVTCFQLILYYLTGQPNETSRIVPFWAICALMGWTAQMCGMVVGSIFPAEVGPYVVHGSTIPMILFSGCFIRYSELLDVFKPLTFVSHFRYGFEGLSLATYGFNRTELGCDDVFCYYRKSRKVLRLLELEQSDYWMSVAALGVWIAVLHLLLYTSLWVRLRRNQ